MYTFLRINDNVNEPFGRRKSQALAGVKLIVRFPTIHRECIEGDGRAFFFCCHYAIMSHRR